MKRITLIILSFLGSFFVAAQSPYINKVYDFCPAPGQFSNSIPEYEEGDTREDIILKAENCIKGEENVLISLGGYGGYIVFGFDHKVENKKGKYDFRILGNAFYAEGNPNPNAPGEGGSCEPGIVMVSHDDNGNGFPDDPWYELAGSEYHKAQTIKNYKITYYKPKVDHEAMPDPEYPFINDAQYILWKSNQGDSGYIARNVFHSQSYYPLWLDSDSLVFEGTKLANNSIDESGDGSYFVLYAYPWGYADNHPNKDIRSAFNIGWAVDSCGNSVDLAGIHFVKVYTGVNQSCGWLGESSVEIMGAEDLHLQGVDANVPELIQISENEFSFINAKVFYAKNRLYLQGLEGANAYLFSIDGHLQQRFTIQADREFYDINLPPGMYILRAQRQKEIQSFKVIIL